MSHDYFLPTEDYSMASNQSELDRSPTWNQSHVRFKSKADICAAKSDVRFTPNSDIDCVFRHVCFGPIADICRTLGSRHQLGWHPQQGKVVPVAAHIRVGGREHAERIVLEQPGVQVVVHVIPGNERFVSFHRTIK